MPYVILIAALIAFTLPTLPRVNLPEIHRHG